MLSQSSMRPMKNAGVKPEAMSLNKIRLYSFSVILVLHLIMTVPAPAQSVQERKLSLPATVITNASDQYSHPTLLRTFLMGKNYRSEWAKPVPLPVFDVKLLGLTATELGG